MASIRPVDSRAFDPRSVEIAVLHQRRHLPLAISYCRLPASSLPPLRRHHSSKCCLVNPRRIASLSVAAAEATAESAPPRNRMYTVGDFMTKKKDLHVVKSTTTVEEAWEVLVEKGITGFPVINDDWELVGVVSDYDLLALDSISGCGQSDTNLFPDINSSWNAFNEIQKLLSKTNGKVIGDLMTHAPLVVHESTILGDAARLLLENKFRRLPVVDRDGKLVGIITRGNIVRAALQIKRANKNLL